MAEIDKWMPMWIDDYMGDTMFLSTEEHGAYLLVLFAYWKNQGPIPENKIGPITRLDRGRWDDVVPFLSEFFIVEDGLWKHKRCEEELEKARLNHEKRSKKARRAATVRWQKEKGDAPSNAPSMLQACSKQCSGHAPSNA